MEQEEVVRLLLNMEILTRNDETKIVEELLNGKTVVFPTETSYGLLCDATNTEAVKNIFEIKGRSLTKALLVVVPSVEMAKKYLRWNEQLEKIAVKYWPGAVTVVGDVVPPLLHKGEDRRRGLAVTQKVMPCSFSFERKVGDVKNMFLRRKLRTEATKAEKILWSHLRSKRLGGGLKFRRQHGIGPFIVDFFHAESKTIIELDGDIHFVEEKQVVKDLNRQEWLEKHGYKVLRFNNFDIFENLEGVLRHVYYNLSSRSLLCEGEKETRRGQRDDLSSCPLLCEGEEETTPLANGVVSGDNTVAVRVTDFEPLKSLAEKAGRPLVATSANVSGEGEAYSAEEIILKFGKQNFQPDYFVDFGELPKRKPTTIVRVYENKFEVLRQGEVRVSFP